MPLVICPTPIGNLGDASPRQREALESADVIACEDTRSTGKLLELLGIARHEGIPRLVSYHDFNAEQRLDGLLSRLGAGEKVVLVSDAGTPTVSDPGFRLVRACWEAGVPIEALPGPVAAITALSAAGLPSDRFLFAGFLPAKAASRREALEELNRHPVTTILYESPHRLVALLDDVEAVWGPETTVYVGRELTKRHEEHQRGLVAEVRARFAERDAVLGEVVVVLGAPALGDDEQGEGAEGRVAADELIDALLDEQVPPRAIKGVVARLLGLSKSEVFDRMEARKEKRS